MVRLFYLIDLETRRRRAHLVVGVLVDDIGEQEAVACEANWLTVVALALAVPTSVVL